MKKILITVQKYLQKYKVDNLYQVDAIIIVNSDIEYIENITL